MCIRDRDIPYALWMVFVLWGTATMAHSSLTYLELGELHPFALEKYPLPQPELWFAALVVHVPTALFALPACWLLQTRWMLRRFPRAHRYLGRLTALVLLVAVVPSGAYLALFAKGGWPSTVGFLLSGAIVVVAMVRSVQAARSRRFREHRRYSGHVFAQLVVAIVSRVILVGADRFALDPVTTYVVALWGPVLGCALVAEWWYGSRSFSWARLRPGSVLGGRYEKARTDIGVGSLR